MYNKKPLSKAVAELDKAKAPKKPKDIITDPMGQWKYPGLPTRIPGNDITMEGVGYPVLGVANNGQRKIMLPGADYTFPGADYVDEYPQMKKGGERKRRKTKSITGTNKIMLPNPLLRNYKNRVYDPNVDYFQEGGVSSLEGNLISKVLMERNKDKDFVQRAYALGKNPGTSMFNVFDPDEFGQTMSHKMAWGEDDNGQAYMFPTVMNPKNEAIRVPNQYADYISNEGYKRATGMIPAEDYIEADLTDDEIEEYRKGGYIVEDISVPELNQAQKGGESKVILTKEHTDKKGNKTIVVTKDDGTKYTKVISKDGKVYNNTQTGLSPEMKEYYKKKADWEDRSSGAAQPVDEFWTLPIGMTSAGVKGTVGLAKGLGSLASSAAKSSLVQAGKAGLKKSLIKSLPGSSINNLVKANFISNALSDIITGKVAEPWKIANESGKGSDYINAVSENMFTALDAYPLYNAAGKGLKQLGKYAKTLPGKLSKTKANSIPKRATSIGLDTYSGDSFAPIRIGGKKYKHAGQEWYNVDPGDYPGMTWEETQKQGLQDASESLNYLFKKNPKYSKEIFDNVGDFDYKQFSEGDEALKKLKSTITSEPMLGKSDVYSNTELQKKIQNYKKWRNEIDEIYKEYKKLDPSGNSSNSELRNLHPHLKKRWDALKNIDKSITDKFITKEQEKLIRENYPELISTLDTRNDLSRHSLKILGEDKLKKPIPQEAIDILKSLNLYKKPNKNLLRFEPGKMNKLGGLVKAQKGGIVLKLTSKEIQDYIKQGYIVEEVDEPKMQTGGQLPYQVWQEKTGTPWSEAKRQGLTDGSASANIALMNKLLAGETPTVGSSTPRVTSAQSNSGYEAYDRNVKQMVSNGASLEDLVKIRMGTREGLVNRFPDLFSASNAKSKEINKINIPQNKQTVATKVDTIVNKPDTAKINSVLPKLRHLPESTITRIPAPKVDTPIVKKFEKSKIKAQEKIKQKETEDLINNIRQQITPDTLLKEKRIPSGIIPLTPKPKTPNNFRPVITDTNMLPKIDTPLKTKSPKDIIKLQNTLKPGVKFEKGTKLTVEPEKENKIIKEDADYKVISNLTQRLNKFDESLQSYYYDYTNPHHTPEKRKQATQNFKAKIAERNNLINLINSKKRDYAGGLDSWIDESAPAWIKKPAQKMDLSEQVEATSYKLPTLKTFKQKEEEDNEKFRTTKRVDDLSGNEKGSRWQFRVSASNDDPMKVQLYGTRGERNPNLNIKAKGAVMHFLDQSPLTGYMHPLTKDYYNNLKPDAFVGKLEKQKDGNYAVKYVPKKDISAKELTKNTFLIRQEKFDNIDFSKKVADDNFSGHTYWTKKGTNKATIPVSSAKDANVYDYSSGQSVVFIFPYKGKTRYVHFAGSPNAIKKEGEEIKKQYKLQANKLVLGVADAGSYSSAVKGNITDKKLKDWNYGYANRNSFTGAGMALVD